MLQTWRTLKEGVIYGFGFALGWFGALLLVGAFMV